ncbi:hypothetical protein LTR85_002735 [Meristemomyces frigidus]|nr:hypothetical protein LTR85_002735 [Meristemomyces frigidus]
MKLTIQKPIDVHDQDEGWRKDAEGYYWVGMKAEGVSHEGSGAGVEEGAEGHGVQDDGLGHGGEDVDEDHGVPEATESQEVGDTTQALEGVKLAEDEDGLWGRKLEAAEAEPKQEIEQPLYVIELKYLGKVSMNGSRAHNGYRSFFAYKSTETSGEGEGVKERLAEVRPEEFRHQREEREMDCVLGRQLKCPVAVQQYPETQSVTVLTAALVSSTGDEIY